MRSGAGGSVADPPTPNADGTLPVSAPHAHNGSGSENDCSTSNW
jgi:hypothetical protein